MTLGKTSSSRRIKRKYQLFIINCIKPFGFFNSLIRQRRLSRSPEINLTFHRIADIKVIIQLCIRTHCIISCRYSLSLQSLKSEPDRHLIWDNTLQILFKRQNIYERKFLRRRFWKTYFELTVIKRLLSFSLQILYRKLVIF